MSAYFKDHYIKIYKLETNKNFKLDVKYQILEERCTNNVI